MAKIVLIPKAAAIIKKIGAVFCFLTAAVLVSLAINTIGNIDAGLLNDSSHIYGLQCILEGMLALLLLVAGEELWKSD